MSKGSVEMLFEELSSLFDLQLGRAFVLFIVCMLFPEMEISEEKKSQNSISDSSVHYMEDICTLWNGCATLPTEMQVSGTELLQSLY